MAPRIFIFSTVLSAECLSYLKSIETHARAFLTLIILAIGTVNWIRLCIFMGNKGLYKLSMCMIMNVAIFKLQSHKSVSSVLSCLFLSCLV